MHAVQITFDFNLQKQVVKYDNTRITKYNHISQSATATEMLLFVFIIIVTNSDIIITGSSQSHRWPITYCDPSVSPSGYAIWAYKPYMQHKKKRVLQFKFGEHVPADTCNWWCYF